MPPPLDPQKREAIAQAIRDGGTRNAIARNHGVSPGIVTKIAQDDGIDDAFDRSSIKRAAEAREIDLAAWRTTFAHRMARRAEWLDDRIDDDQAVVVVTKDGSSIEYVETPAKDARDYLVAIGIAVDKIGVLTRDDSQGLAAVDSWLRSLGVGATT